MAFEDFDRTAGVGGSDVPAILGVSPWATRTDVWMEKVHHPQWRPKEVSPEMRFGTLLEPIIRQAYEEDTGLRVWAPGEKTYWDKERIGYAHLDGLVEGEGIWEGKAPFQTWRKWDLGPPVYVHAQVQHYLSITGEPWCDVSALAAGLDPIFQTWRVQADPEAQDFIRTAVYRFWRNHVQTGDPPEPLPAAIEFPRHKGDLVIVADEEDEALVSWLREEKARGATSTAREEEIKETLKKRIGPAAGMQGNGWHIRLKSNRDSEKTDWHLVAGTWRKQLEEVERTLIDVDNNHPSAEARIEEALRLLTDTAPAATVVSLYTTVRPGARPFNLVIEEDK